MFPTTIWTTIREAGEEDREALERFAGQYRDPVLRYLNRRRVEDPEDLCQDVFVRLFQGGVLGKADRARGRFRSLLLSVLRHTLQDRLRRRRDDPREIVDLPSEDEDAEFDRGWVEALVERALAAMRADGSPYFAVLRGHLDGTPQDRNKLWIARGKLSARIRGEIALTCSTHAEYEAELRYLSQFIDAGKK